MVYLYCLTKIYLLSSKLRITQSILTIMQTKYKCLSIGSNCDYCAIYSSDSPRITAVFTQSSVHFLCVTIIVFWCIACVCVQLPPNSSSLSENEVYQCSQIVCFCSPMKWKMFIYVFICSWCACVNMQRKCTCDLSFQI